MSIFLVDFENTHSGGLNSFKKLSETDEIEIFYSDSVNSMTFDLHTRILKSRAKFVYTKITNGTKNALDFILLTQLACKISENPNDNYFIISKDKGFDVICDWWKDKKVNVVRIEEISRFETSLNNITEGEQPAAETQAEPVIAIPAQQPEIKAEPNPEPQTDEKTEATAQGAAESIPAAKTADIKKSAPAEKATKAKTESQKQAQKQAQNKKQQNADNKNQPAKGVRAEIIAQLNAANIADAAPIADTVILYIEKYKTKQGIHNALVKEYPSKDNEKAAGIYKAIKTFIKDKK